MTAQTATLSGAYRGDALIELTGTVAAFREIARRTRQVFRTLPYLASGPAGDAEPDTQVKTRFLPWMLTKQPPGLRFALITPEAFKAAGLEPFVEMQNDPAPSAPSDAAKALSETLKALLIDRRDLLRLEQIPEAIKARLGADIDAKTIEEALSGQHIPRSKTLNALLLVLHAHKPLSPGHLGTITGQLGHELDATVRHLLQLPFRYFKQAYYSEQIQVGHNGEVTLAGLAVSPETTVIVLDNERQPWRREGGRNLRSYARPRHWENGQGYSGRG